MKQIIKERIIDLLYSVCAGIIVSFGLYIFSSQNNFAPGGISGIAYILEMVTGIPGSMGYYLIAFNLPLFILTSIFVEKKLGIYLSIYVFTQSLTLILLNKLGFPYAFKATDGTKILAAIATGVITGIGFAIQIKRHGASGGTYAISALVKHWKPAANIAWFAFAMDSAVVFIIFFVNIATPDAAIISTICTLINLFIADLVVDYCLQGSKEGYKFEIITDYPDELAEEVMRELKHGVTEMRVSGMYTHKQRYMIVCIIRKRELSRMMRILKKYPKSFAEFSRVNEVFGNFKK